MFKIVKVIIKIAYIIITVLLATRIVLRCNGIKPFSSGYKYIVEPIYNITETLSAPFSYIFSKIQGILPETIHNYFPEIFIRHTGGTFEWYALTALAVFLILGLMLEHFAGILTEYESAFLTIGKSGMFSSNGRNKTLKRLKSEPETQESINAKEGALKEAYNIIIKRLDREKTELVNKNIALEKEVITDTLTGLKTRKYLDERLKYELSSAKIRKSNLSVIMFDIDHFKRINDELGHQVGDVVLKEVAQIIIQACSTNVVASRYGGEEILIIGPKLNTQEATNLAEQIRNRIESSVIYDKKNRKSVTISAGVATYKANDIIHTPEELIERADSALYDAKNNGRNQVKVYK